MKPVSASGDNRQLPSTPPGTSPVDKPTAGALAHSSSLSGDTAVQAVAAQGAGRPSQVPAATGQAPAASLAGGRRPAGLPTGTVAVGSAATRSAITQPAPPVGRLGDLLAAWSIKPETAALTALQAMMAEQLPLRPETVRSLRNLARRHAGHEALASAVGARALASGVELTDRAVEGLAGFFDSGSQPDGSSADGQPRGGQPGDDSSRGLTPRPPSLGPDPVASLAQALRRVAQAAAAEFFDLAQPAADGAAWLFVPFNFSERSLDFRGMLRIHYNYVHRQTEALILDLSTAGGQRSFAVAGHGRILSVRPVAAVEGRNDPVVRRLEAVLRAAGLIVTVREVGDEGDGRKVGSWRGVDEQV